MDITRVRTDDDALLEALVEFTVAVQAADSPWQFCPTRRGLRADLTSGWDGEPNEGYVAVHDGQIVAAGELWLPARDNIDSAWSRIGVHPQHRKAGHGSRLLEHLEGVATAAGRGVLGIEGWDSPHTRGFAASRGYDLKYVSVIRRVALAEVPVSQVDAAYEEARAVATDYDVVRIAGPLTDEQITESLPVVASINDAPTDELLIEDEVYTADRLRAYDDASLARGLRLYRVWARRRDTGEVAGHTVVAVERDRPAIGEQHDTTVLAKHRGHRLGLLLKADMMRWLREAEPALETITTDNAESNRHMIAVNERLGYRVLARNLGFQRQAAGADTDH